MVEVFKATKWDASGRICEVNDEQSIVPVDPQPFVGRCWVGDPCYLFGGDHPDGMASELWITRFCARETGIWCRSDYGFFSFGKYVVAWSGTGDGDGRFQVAQHGFEMGQFGVDAGLFCVVPEGLIAAYAPRWLTGNYSTSGVWIELKNPAAVEFHEGEFAPASAYGDATIGKYQVWTCDRKREDEDDRW